MLNLFFEVPDADRWVPLDRHARRLYRSLFRRRQPIAGGYRRSFRDLRISLDKLQINYRLNDYAYIRTNPTELACVYGYPHVLTRFLPEVPIMFGAGGYSHPLDNPALLRSQNVKRILVKGAWMVEMCRPYWGDLVHEWAAPINTHVWAPTASARKDIDLIVYDKIRWNRGTLEPELVNPLLDYLRVRNLTVVKLRYGEYLEADLARLAKRSKAMIFLCEHETQGLAYQQVLSSDVPILAWDRGGLWQDPAYYPESVRFGPVSSVPYWDERCGMKFKDFAEFRQCFDHFWKRVANGSYSPRAFVAETLSFEKCGMDYLRHAEACCI